MKSVSFLILSDIHFGAMSDHIALTSAHSPPVNSLTNAKDIIVSLIETLASAPPDFILVPGDLTSRATPAEFRGCVGVVERIATSLNVNHANIYYTFGNHDTNWRVADLAEADEVSDADTGYHGLAGTIGNLFVKHPLSENCGPLPSSALYELPDYQIFVLNSGYYNIRQQDISHGKLGQEQLSWFKDILCRRNPEKWGILMLHHHPFRYRFPVSFHDVSDLEEGAELLDIIGRAGIDFVCHGHRHHPIHKTKTEADWKHPITFFCAGSMGVKAHERNDGQIPNLCHMIYLKSKTSQDAAFGEIHTYKYTYSDGWYPSSYSKEVPIDPIQTFGSVASDLDCKRAATNVILGAIPIAQPGYGALPIQSELPTELLCLPTERMFEILQAVADEHGCEIVGSYPKDHQPVVIRRT